MVKDVPSGCFLAAGGPSWALPAQSATASVVPVPAYSAVDDEVAVMDPAGADQGVRYGADPAVLSPHHEDLEAVVEIEVYVEGGHDVIVVAVLQGREPPREVSGAVVVDQRDGADHL